MPFKIIVTRDFDHMSEVATQIVVKDIKIYYATRMSMFWDWLPVIHPLAFINVLPP